MLEIIKVFHFDILVSSSLESSFSKVLRNIEYSCCFVLFCIVWFFYLFFFFYLPDKTVIYIAKRWIWQIFHPILWCTFFFLIAKYEVTTWLYGPGTQVSMQWFWAGFWSYIEIQSIIKPNLFKSSLAEDSIKFQPLLHSFYGWLFPKNSRLLKYNFHVSALQKATHFPHKKHSSPILWAIGLAVNIS